MRLGVSSYSFAASLAAGRLDLEGVVDRVADLGASHLEIALVGSGTDLLGDPGLAERVRERAERRALPLESYVLAADLSGPDPTAEVERLRRHIDLAADLGITRVRHDVVPWAWRDASHAEFEQVLERLVPVVREVAEHAASRGVTTMVENHGMCFNDPERLLRLLDLVDHASFRLTLDVGNFLCVAADPVLAVRRLLPSAEVVHLKDFRIRPQAPSADWLRTLSDRAILGTVVGWGDLPLATIAGDIVASGFTGPVSIEFEGPEDDGLGVTAGLESARALFAGVES